MNVWHLKDKRHYEVARETPAYYFVYTDTKKNIVKRVGKSSCVEHKPQPDKNTYTVTLTFNKPVLTSQNWSTLPSSEYKSEVVVKLLSFKSLANLTEEVYDELNGPKPFIKFGQTFYRKSEIFSLCVAE